MSDGCVRSRLVRDDDTWTRSRARAGQTWTRSGTETRANADARSNVSNCKRLRLDSFQKNARPLPAFTLIHSSTPCLHPPQLRAKRNYTVFLNRLFFNAGCGEIELKWTKSVFSARGKCKHDAAVLHQPSFVLHPPDGAIVIPLYST